MILQLQKLRKKAGYKTQGAFAEALGVPERRYQSWEREEAMMSLEQAYNVTELLGCTLEELVGRKTSKSFANPNQQRLNDCYENMNEKGQATLVSVAQGLEKDIANRIVKEGQEYLADQQGA